MVLNVMDVCARSYPRCSIDDVVVEFSNLLEQYVTPPYHQCEAVTSCILF